MSDMVMLMSENCPLLERQQSSTRCIVPTVQKCWGQQAYAVEQRSALAFASLISLERDWGRESPSACAYFKQISRVTQAVLSCLQEWLRKRPNGRSICLLFEYCVIGSHTSRPHLATSHKPGCRTASKPGTGLGTSVIFTGLDPRVPTAQVSHKNGGRRPLWWQTTLPSLPGLYCSQAQTSSL